MANPKVSVIIPTYNGTDYLGEAIDSIINQTYPHFEVIVVDDASPVDTASIVNRFNDERVKYYQHEQNRGAVAARHTGVLASSGDIIAFLDQDDLFHKDKLQAHVTFLQEHSEVGATYNARFEVQDSSKTISGLWQPPRELKLADFVLGYPVAPSDLVLRREWALLDEIWDDSFAREAEHVIFNGQEIIFGGRLVMAGCLFGNVGRALNYRRFHSQRILKHLALRCSAELACQEMIFRDARCPQDALALRNIASANIYLIWALIAYTQEEADLGQEYLSKAVELKPSLMLGEPCELITSWFAWVAKDVWDFDRQYEIIIHSIFNNLSPKLQELNQELDGVIARGYLWKGIEATIWGNHEDAQTYFAQAERRRVRIDDAIAQSLVGELLDYEAEFGAWATQKIIQDLTAHLDKVGNQRGSRALQGYYWVNQAFRSYRLGEYSKVPTQIFHGVVSEPKFLNNRGVLSLLLRSLGRERSG